MKMSKIHIDNIIQDKEFIERFGPEGIKPLGQGEYNINYVFIQRPIKRNWYLELPQIAKWI